MAKKFLDSNGLSHLWSKLKEKFASKNHKHTKSEITDFPSSMPASDVYDWAKKSTKPSYAASEISGLAVVAKSGSYDDLTNKPTIPAGLTVDTNLDLSSTNPVQNAVITQRVNRMDEDITTIFSDMVIADDVAVASTANKIVKRDANGDINARYVNSSWLLTSSVTDKGSASYKGVAIVDNSGWVYYRSKDNIKADLGIKNITLTENADGTVDISIT